MQTESALDRIRSDLSIMDDWEDRYRYIIELGRALPALPDDLRTDTNKVRGCASQVWLATNIRRADGGGSPIMELQGDSDAHIVRGLVAVLFAVYQGKSTEEILRTDAKTVFAELGLKEHLTPQRSNGFASMVERIMRDARAPAAAN